jgi:hypothetical protein
MTTKTTLLDIAEEALEEAHGWCQEYGSTPAHRDIIEKCPKHSEAWATVQQARAEQSSRDDAET